MTFSKAFWRSTADRVIVASSAAMLALMNSGGPINIVHLNWGDILGITAQAAVATVLISIVSGTGVVGPTGSPALTTDPAAAGQGTPGVRPEG